MEECQSVCRDCVEGQSSSRAVQILCQIQRNTQGWWWTWLCVWQWSCSQISSDCSTESHLHFFWFLCQSLLDEALLSTLPPSNMVQSEPLYTQAAAAASTSLDHQDTAEPLSTRTPGCSLIHNPSPADERRRNNRGHKSVFSETHFISCQSV